MAKNSRWRSGMFVAALLCAAGLLAAAARAQSTSAPGQEAKQTAEEKAKAPEKPTTEVKEEITVTSTLREEKLQDVPFSVSATSGADLQAQGIDSIESVSDANPGLIVQNLGPGQSQVAMRGVSGGQIVRDQPGVKESVGIYLDDSVMSLGLFTPDVEIFDLARIEVLKGPQGTLFGAGSESGTVRYITNQPRLEQSNGYAEFGFNAIDKGGTGGFGRVAANAGIGKSSALRFVGYYDSIAGYIDAVQPDLSVKKDVNGGRRTGGRLALLLQPTENLTITPRVLYQDVKMDGFNRIDVYNILANPYTTTRPPVELGERRQFTQIGEPFTDKFTLADLNINYHMGNAEFTSVTSYDHRDILQIRDAGALTSSITGGSIGLPENVYTLDSPLDDATELTAWTQEFRLQGATEKFDWLVGAFYDKARKNYGQDLSVAGFEELTGIPTTGVIAPKDSLYFSRLHYDFKQYALFGEVSWKVTEAIGLTGGLRWYKFDESRSQFFDGLFVVDHPGVDPPVSNPGKTDATGVAPRLIASFSLSPETRLNAQVSRGFRLGGINDALNAPLCTPQDLVIFGGHDTWVDEKTWNYEVGTKSVLMGGNGSLNASVFYNDISNLQTTVTAGSCSSRIIFNVPKARSQGLEAEFAGSPTPNWSYSLSGTYTDSELRSSVGDAQSVAISGLKAGNRLPTVPRFQAAASLTYQWQVHAEWLASVTGSYQYVGSRFTQTGDQAVGFGTVNLYSFDPHNIGGPYTQDTFAFNPELPAYHLANLRFGFEGPRWDFGLAANNLTDERAYLALDQERGTRARVGYLTNQPRNFAATVGVHF